MILMRNMIKENAEKNLSGNGECMESRSGSSEGDEGKRSECEEKRLDENILPIFYKILTKLQIALHNLQNSSQQTSSSSNI